MKTVLQSFLIAILFSSPSAISSKKYFVATYVDDAGEFYSLLKKADEKATFDKKINVSDSETDAEIKKFYKLSKKVFDKIKLPGNDSCLYTLFATYGIQQESFSETENGKWRDHDQKFQTVTIKTIRGNIEHTIIGRVILELQSACPDARFDHKIKAAPFLINVPVRVVFYKSRTTYLLNVRIYRDDESLDEKDALISDKDVPTVSYSLFTRKKSGMTLNPAENIQASKQETTIMDYFKNGMESFYKTTNDLLNGTPIDQHPRGF